MKKHYTHIYYIVVFLCLPALDILAQNVGINATGAVADTSAGLDVSFTNKGLLIPRIALTATGDAATITRPATGLMVYNTGTGGLAPAGYYYNAGTKAAPNWTNFIANNWKITGNSGMVDGTNFIGTTDSVAFNFRVRNFTSGRIDPAGSVFFGYKAGFINNDVTNTGIGYKALYSVTDGAGNGGANTAVGYKALYSNLSKNNTACGYTTLALNTSGSYNTACGHGDVPGGTLYSNVTGSYNTGIGNSALGKNLASYNTAIGMQALANNTSGSNNTSNGYLTLPSNTLGNYNTADGYQSLNSNSTASENTALGYFALRINTLGTKNTAIGSNASVNTNSLSTITSVGYLAVAFASNTMILGGTVNAGIGVTTPLSTLTVAGSIAGKYREGNTIAMDATDFFINLTAAGGSTLPAANIVTAGTHMIVRNSTTAAITLSRSGTDTMCNVGVGCAQTSVSIPAYSVVHYTSDGTSVWIGW